MTTEQRADKSTQFQQKKELMLSGATTLINLHGLKGAKLADVAEHASLSLKSVRYYFTRKEDLVNACFERAFGAYDLLIDQAAEGQCPTARVNRLIDAWMDLYARIRRQLHPPILNFGHVTAVDDRPDHPVRMAYRRMFTRLEHLLAETDLAALSPQARETTTIRTHFVLSQLLWAVVWIGRYDVDHLYRVGEHMQRVLASGLLPDGEPWAPTEITINGPEDAVDEHHEAFLRAATTLINQHGYRGASVEKIAGELRKTKGAFYHRLDAKDSLVEGCFVRTLGLMRSAQQMAEQASPRAAVRLASMASALTRFQGGQRGPLLRTSALAAVPLAAKEDMKLRLDAITQRIYDTLTDGILEGSVRPVDAWIAAQMINGAINSAAELKLWVPGMAPQDAIDRYMRPLFTGFLAT